MAIAVPAANPANIDSVNDLAKPGVKVAVCQAQVPCGGIATKVFANARITVTPVSQEADVKAVLTKVTLGEVDAGIVYVTDVKVGGGQGQGHRDPGRRQRLDDLPDRRADQGGEPDRGPGASSTTSSPRRGWPS